MSRPYCIMDYWKVTWLQEWPCNDESKLCKIENGSW